MSLQIARRLAVSAMVLTLSFSAASTVLAAPLAGANHPVSGQPAKVKTINFNLRNDSTAAVTLKAGEQEITVDAGKTVALHLPEGVQLLAVTATAHLEAGSMVTTVSSALKGNTLAIS